MLSDHKVIIRCSWSERCGAFGELDGAVRDFHKNKQILQEKVGHTATSIHNLIYDIRMRSPLNSVNSVQSLATEDLYAQDNQGKNEPRDLQLPSF